MKTITSRRPLSESRDEYLDLIKKLPLRPIRNEDELSEAHALMLPLFARRETGRLSAGAADYLDTLTLLIHDYETRRHPLRRASPLDCLTHLMQEKAMRVGDLARVIGSASAASMIVSGKRRISRTQAAALAKFFKVEPALFL